MVDRILKIVVDKHGTFGYNNTCVDKKTLIWKKVTQDNIGEFRGVAQLG